MYHTDCNDHSNKTMQNYMKGKASAFLNFLKSELTTLIKREILDKFSSIV